jgi:hypothetical protein
VYVKEDHVLEMCYQLGLIIPSSDFGLVVVPPLDQRVAFMSSMGKDSCTGVELLFLLRYSSSLPVSLFPTSVVT